MSRPVDLSRRSHYSPPLASVAFGTSPVVCGAGLICGARVICSAGLVICSALLAACGLSAPDPAPSRPSIAADESPVLPPTMTPETEEPTSVSWPEGALTLRQSLQAFESEPSCRARLNQQTPVSVMEALADLGYGHLPEDICRSLHAVKDGDVQACEALSLSTARRGCLRRLAIAHHRPMACPRAPSATSPSVASDGNSGPRQALCLAWATGDPRLCHAVPNHERDLCAAVLFHQVERCEALGEAAACISAVRRYSPSIELVGEESMLDDPREPFSVDITYGEGDAERTVSVPLVHGVPLVPEGCNYRLSVGAGHFGSARLGHSTLLEATAESSGRVHLGLLFPPGSDESGPVLGLGALDAVLTISDQAGELSSLSGARGDIRLAPLELNFGELIVAEIEGAILQGERWIPIRGHLRSYVADFEPLPARCGDPQ